MTSSKLVSKCNHISRFLYIYLVLKVLPNTVQATYTTFEGKKKKIYIPLKGGPSEWYFRKNPNLKRAHDLGKT